MASARASATRLLLAAGELARIALGEAGELDEASMPRRRETSRSAGATLRISRPKATFSETVMCGKSA
jgi:hypothetical protein